MFPPSAAKKSGMRGSEAPPSAADEMPGADPAGAGPGAGEADPPVSHFVHQDEHGDHHMNISKLHAHLSAKK